MRSAPALSWRLFRIVAESVKPRRLSQVSIRLHREQSAAERRYDDAVAVSLGITRLTSGSASSGWIACCNSPRVSSLRHSDSLGDNDIAPLYIRPNNGHQCEHDDFHEFVGREARNHFPGLILKKAGKAVHGSPLDPEFW